MPTTKQSINPKTELKFFPKYAYKLSSDLWDLSIYKSDGSLYSKVIGDSRKDVLGKAMKVVKAVNMHDELTRTLQSLFSRITIDGLFDKTKTEHTDAYDLLHKISKQAEQK